MKIEVTDTEIVEPQVKRKLTNADLLIGKPLEPIKKLQVISEDDFEDMVREWAVDYLQRKYVKVRRCGGSGDMGRDVIGYEVYNKRDNQVIWDNYQCKYYDKALSPGDIWLELGKLCYYTFKGHFTVPRSYFFVAPKGVTTALGNLLDSPDDIKKELKSKWKGSCERKITEKNKIVLAGDLSNYIDNFDFSIFNYIDPQELIKQHSQTRYFFYRFGGMQAIRPEPLSPPEEVTKDELPYIRKLLEAYSDNHKLKALDLKELSSHDKYSNHLDRQRKSFYSAESLMRFERDTLPPGANAFEDLKDEIYEGIIDILESDHEDGFERVKKVCQTARTLNVPSYPLRYSLKNSDLSGICHHLANENKIKNWVI